MTLGSMDHGEGRAAQLVQLEPLIHQVSGHSSLWVLDDVTVCKPLIGREAKFYRTLPPQMRPFTPEFRGTLKVLVERTAEGVVVAALPPNAGERSYFTSRRSSDHRTNSRKKVSRVRACNVELASEGEEVGGEMVEEEDEDDNLHLPMIGPPIPRVMPAHNPWLKECHQRYLDKLKKKAENKVNVMECILLENLTHIYRVPNVLDLKMGTRQYGDDAPESKRRSQTRKAQHTTTPRLGVRLAGMQVYDRDAKCYVCKNKYVGRELSEDGFQQTLRHFLHNGRRFRTDIVDQIIAKLTDLRRVVASLDSFRFFTSSLLILYDSYDTKGASKGKDNMTTAKDKESLLSASKEHRISDSRSKENLPLCGKEKRSTTSKDRESFSVSNKEKRNSTSKEKDSSLSSAKDKRTSEGKDKERKSERDNRRNSREGNTSLYRNPKRTSATTSELPQIPPPSVAATSAPTCAPYPSQEALQKVPENNSISVAKKDSNLENHFPITTDCGEKDDLPTQSKVIASMTSSVDDRGDGSETRESLDTAACSGTSQLEKRASDASSSIETEFFTSVDKKITQEIRQSSHEIVSISQSQRISLPNDHNSLDGGIRPNVNSSQCDRIATKDDKDTLAVSFTTNASFVSYSAGSQPTTSNFSQSTVPLVSVQKHVTNTNVIVSSMSDSIENELSIITGLSNCIPISENSRTDLKVVPNSGSCPSNSGSVSLSGSGSVLDSQATVSPKSLPRGSVNSGAVSNPTSSCDANKNAGSSSALRSDSALSSSSVGAHSNSSDTALVPALNQDAKVNSRLSNIGEQQSAIVEVLNKDLTVPVQTCVTCHSSVPNTNSPSLSNNNIGSDPCQSLDNVEKSLPNSVPIASSLDTAPKSPSTILAVTCNNNPAPDTCSSVSSAPNALTGPLNTSHSSVDQGGTVVSSSNTASSSTGQGSSPGNLTKNVSVASNDSACKTKVDIRLIDFAHATHKGMGDATIYSGPDEGLMLGLKSLINIFTDIKEYYAK